MLMIEQLIFFVLTFFISSLILGAVLIKIFAKERKIFSLADITILSLGFGPIFISAILYFLFLFFPHKPNWFYITIIGLFFAVIGLIARKDIRNYLGELKIFFSGIKTKIISAPKDILIMGFLAIAIGIYVFVQGVVYPILSSDGSTYAAIGQYLYEEKSLANFPMKVADEETGFYFGGAQHPPGLPLIYTWLYLLSGDTQSDVLLRTVSPLYTLYLVILLWLVLKVRAGKYAGMFGVLLMVLTPIVVWQAYENSIDPLRLFFIFAAFILLSKFLKKENLRLALLAGASIGFALYIHATGIIVFFVAILIYLVFAKLEFRKRIGWALMITLFALVFGGTQYAINYFKFGNVLGKSSYSVISPKVKDFYSPAELEWQGQSGTILLLKKIQIPKDLIFGRLQIFSRPELFGLTYYLFVFAFIYWLRKKGKQPLDYVILWSAILCAAPIIYKFYVNRRYVLTIHPMAAYFGGLMLGSIYENLKKKKWIKWFWIGLLVAFLAASAAYFLPSSISSQKLLSDSKNTKTNYLLASKKEQNKILASGLFEAIDFLNQQTPKDSKVLTFNNGRYYYYAQRYGTYWSEPRMSAFYLAEDKIAAYQYLRDLGIDYVIIDQIYKGDKRFKESYLKDIAEDGSLSKLVFEGDTKVYQLIK